MSKIIDVRGGEHGPLLGRLRGVTARHELREFVIASSHNYFVANDAHFVFRGEVPSPVPDLLSTSERQLVVSKRLAEALCGLDPTIELVPVRLVDSAGETVESDHAVAVVKAIERIAVGGGNMGPSGYLYNQLRDLAEPEGPVPPLFRVMYSLAIGCNDAAAAVLAKFTGVTLVALPDYVEVAGTKPAPPYMLLRVGTTGAVFANDTHERTGALELGEAVLADWPEAGPFADMTGPKSRKKIVDFMDGGGAPIVGAKAKALLERHGLIDVDFLPVRLRDHAKKPVKGEHWFLHVRAGRAYVVVAESDIEVVDDLLWHPREVVVDEALLTDRPPLFRVPGARYPWVFIRSDLAAALEASGLVGFRLYDPAQHAYSVEGGDLPHVC